MYEFMLFMAEIVLHSTKLCGVHIEKMAKALCLISISFMKRYFKHQMENTTSISNSLRVSNSKLSVNYRTNIERSPSKTELPKDPSHYYACMKRFSRCFKGYTIDFNDNVFELKNIAFDVMKEYKNYINKIYGLKNLEKSFPDFFTEDFQKIINE